MPAWKKSSGIADPSTAVDGIIAALQFACDLGYLSIATKLLVVLENVLARRTADGHAEVEKLYAEIALAKEAVLNLPRTPENIM
jgi:hypothetical protein